MSESQKSKRKSKSATQDPWKSLQRYATSRGEATRVPDPEAYLRALTRDHATDVIEELRRDGVLLQDVLLYRLFVRGKLNARRLESALRDLTEGAQRYTLCLARLSGSENQADGASGGSQELGNVLHALKSGATRILVVCEVQSAAAGKHREIFRRMLQSIRQRKVRAVVAAQLDRLTRSPSDAVAFIEALEASGTELHTPNHRGPVNNYEALALMLQFIMGAFHVIAIRKGNLRGWLARVSDGQWPNTGQPLPGMQLDDRRRPYFSEAARMAIRRLFDLLDPERPEGALPVKAALVQVNSEFPGWWGSNRGGQEGAPSLLRVQRLLHMGALVDGQQQFSFGSDTRIGSYPRLGGTVPRELFERVQRALLESMVSRRRPIGTPWQRLFRELVHERNHPVQVLVDESRGALEFAEDGALRVVCRHCTAEDALKRTNMVEVDPHFDDLELPDGATLKGVASPVFQCDECARTTRPLGPPVLRLLLGGMAPIVCPRCRSHRLDISTQDHISTFAPYRAVQANCRQCRKPFWFDLTDVSPAHRYRYVKLPRSQPTGVDMRPEHPLGYFDAGEDGAGDSGECRGEEGDGASEGSA